MGGGGGYLRGIYSREAFIQGGVYLKGGGGYLRGIYSKEAFIEGGVYLKGGGEGDI